MALLEGEELRRFTRGFSGETLQFNIRTSWSGERCFARADGKAASSTLSEQAAARTLAKKLAGKHHYRLDQHGSALTFVLTVFAS